MTLSELIHQDHFRTPSLEALLGVMVTHSYVQGELQAVMQREGLTHAQYNVLRILRGADPNRVPCAYIGERLLDRTPDVTRLLARLEANGYVKRRRADYDRRVVEVGITDTGRATLARLDGPVDARLAHLTQHLTEDELHTLSHLLEKLRTDQA
ncbi:MAG: MarR family winged helix-turn-helix transcriptional regulator [Bacteroidota bacterium]